MDLLTLASLSELAKTVEWFLNAETGGVGKIGAAIAGGILGNRSDGLVCTVLGSARNYFSNLRTTDPHLNHDLEWAAQKAYLVATQELARQALVRMEVNAAWRIWRPEVDRIRKGVEQDLANEGRTLAARIPDCELWLLDENKQPAERMQQLREAMEEKLRADIRERWTAGAVPDVIENLLQTGWRIDTARIRNVDRNWHALIAIAFMEELKRSPRLAAIFQSKLLVEMANREPRLAPVASSFAHFQTALDKVCVPLQRIEDSLGVLHSKMDALAGDVGEVKAEVRKVSQMLGWWAKLPGTVQSVLGLLLLASLLWAAARFGREFACWLPFSRAWMERWETGERILPLVVRSTFEPFPTNEKARANALERAHADAAEVCQGYRTGVYRLQSARAEPRQWRCTQREQGVVCGFDGTAVCRVQVRTGGCD